MKRLTELQPGESGKVVTIFCSNQGPGFIRRLAALGITAGKEIKILRKCWFLPFHIQVGMTELMIRKQYAQEIMVE